MRADLLPPEGYRVALGLGTEPFDWEYWGQVHAARLQKVIPSGGSLLDLGCGCGRIVPYLSGLGSYTGLDVNLDLIEWCQEHLPGNTFVHADIYNQSYNPNATVKPVDYRLPFDDQQFDAVFACSLFTHLLEPEVEHYHQELYRVIRPGGHLVASHFLIDEAARDAIDTGATIFNYKFSCGHGRTGFSDCPARAIAHGEEWLKDSLSRSGFRVIQVDKSQWRKARTNLVDQDWVVATR